MLHNEFFTHQIVRHKHMEYLPCFELLYVITVEFSLNLSPQNYSEIALELMEAGQRYGDMCYTLFFLFLSPHGPSRKTSLSLHANGSSRKGK